MEAVRLSETLIPTHELNFYVLLYMLKYRL